MSFASTQRLQPTLSSSSRSAGANYGALPTARDYDLTQHSEHSGQPMDYFDPETNEKYIPYVIEPSLGADRVLLAFLCDAYDEETDEKGDVRTVLHFHPARPL